MDSYRILVHPDALRHVAAYRATLVRDGLAACGARLRRELGGDDIAAMPLDRFAERLFATKLPMIFAESAVHGDGRDWTMTELALLGDLAVAVPVTVFDDGRHHGPAIHGEPFPAMLLYVPGALLRSQSGAIPADWPEVVRDGELDIAAYRALYERRLLPLLLHANARAQSVDGRAVVTVPGLGCGQFAGPFAGRLGAHLRDAIAALLHKHAGALERIALVRFDPYAECENSETKFGSVVFRVRPLARGNDGTPQLCAPVRYEEGADDFHDCLLFSMVAWDHVSWPGNDFYGGSRATDDGVKAAATSSMATMTGVEGRYLPDVHAYVPRPPFRSWGEIVAVQGLRMRVEGNLEVLPAGTAV
jgi:hypothetical protein